MNELKEQTEHELIVLLNRVVRTYENWEFATKADDVYEIDEAVKDLMQLIETYTTRKELEARIYSAEFILQYLQTHSKNKTIFLLTEKSEYWKDQLSTELKTLKGGK